MVTGGNIPWKRILVKAILLASLSYGHDTFCQETNYNYFYRIYFKDKGNYNINTFSAADLLSERAIARREKSLISSPDFNDLPVYSPYITRINSMGFILHCTSKWLNTAVFKTQNQKDINPILGLPFVKDVLIVKKPVGKSNYTNKLDFSELQADNPPFDRPVTMLNGYALHNSGYDGTGMSIAVLDGGFLKADLISSLKSLRTRNGIKGTYNFVDKNEHVYNYHNHGTAVLSVLAGRIPGLIEGTSPGADFWLIRTEDATSEFPVEEDFWAAGAEFADSAGADIISSSLGYYNFDDTTMNYKFSDMNGNSAFVTRAADVAASKGILVVASAGNERNKVWKRIVAPSDGDSVIAAGAVDGSTPPLISVFSSAGPSADGRIKPDNVSQGVSVPVQTDENIVGRANGTSFSCPVLSGMCACVMQAVPGANNTDIINALHSTADRHNSPDSLYGYGVPDMAEVVARLEEVFVTKPDNETVIGPNPFTEDIEIKFRQSPGFLRLEIFSVSGFTVVRKIYNDYISRTLKITDLQTREQGIYFIRLITANGTFTHIVIKLKN